MTKYPSKEAREIVKMARKLGWAFIGYTGTNHLLLVHENGSRYVLAATPSSHRNRANSISMLEKLAGCKLHPKGRMRQVS
jgi:predicted RNA binding protein YcfA (HicA-like mRNA interferase family)